MNGAEDKSMSIFKTTNNMQYSTNNTFNVKHNELTLYFFLT